MPRRPHTVHAVAVAVTDLDAHPADPTVEATFQPDPQPGTAQTTVTLWQLPAAVDVWAHAAQ